LQSSVIVTAVSIGGRQNHYLDQDQRNPASRRQSCALLRRTTDSAVVDLALEPMRGHIQGLEVTIDTIARCGALAR
jgi:hypothetical protein